MKPTAQPEVGEAAPVPFVLTPVGFPTTDEGLGFPDAALIPFERSPAFEWSGVPVAAKSLALVVRSPVGVITWVIWDIPPTRTELPEGIRPFPYPSEIPGTSQLGTTMGGYSAPRLPNGEYDFSLWALDVATAPDTVGLISDEVVERRLMPHKIASTPSVIVVNAPSSRGIGSDGR